MKTAVEELRLSQTAFEDKTVTQCDAVTCFIRHAAFNDETTNIPPMCVKSHNRLQAGGEDPLSFFVFIEPVTDIAGFVGWLDGVEGEHTHQHVIFEDQEHFGVAALMQDDVALCGLPGLVNRADMLRPVQKVLQPLAVFNDQLVQIVNKTLINGMQRQVVVDNDQAVGGFHNISSYQNLPP